MTKNAVMWLHDCLDAEKKKNQTGCSQICRQNLSNQLADDPKGGTALSRANCNNTYEKGRGQRQLTKSSTQLRKEKIRLKITVGKG